MNRITIKLLIQLVMTEIAYIAVLWGGLFLCMFMSTFVVWYSWNPVYQILNFFKENVLIFMGAFTLIGTIWIFLHYWKKNMHYLEQMIEASQILVDHREDTQIFLPEDLNQVERVMNAMKVEILKSERSAKESEQRKNDLIVYLAHDLKTPLTSVIGYLSILDEEKNLSNEMKDKYLNIARTKAERLEDLINEFFEITRFNLTTLTLDKSDVNITRMLEQIVWEFKPIAKEKNLKFELDLEENIIANVDVGKMERVFDNLIRNAINYSYENRSVYIAAKKEKDTLFFRFENDGQTIPKEKLSRIFEQFYRLDSARGTQNGGAGLGLAISREIIELHHGTIEAFSENEKIIFEIEIPINKKSL